MNSDALYFRQRANEEEEASLNASHPVARDAHRQLAARYADLAKAIDDGSASPSEPGSAGASEADRLET